MLLVPTKLHHSPIHRLGVFAAAPITAGTIVWRFTPGFDLDLDPRVLDEHPAAFRTVMLHYGYVDPRLRRFILCCDDCRFVNHSDHPNVGSEFSEAYGVDVAVGDIAAGDELTVDYEVVEGRRPNPEPWSRQECSPGQKR